MHLKNFSLIETSEGSAEYVLSPAYIASVNVIMPEDTEKFALTINGKREYQEGLSRICRQLRPRRQTG